MREGLWEVAQHASGPRVVLLRQQTDVVPQVEQSLEQLACLVDLPLHRQDVREPERARQEHSLAGREAVHRAVVTRAVAEHQPIHHQLVTDRVDRRAEAFVGRRQEPEVGHQQDARVQVVGSVRLREGLLSVAPRLRQHIVGDRLTELPPSVDGAVQPELVMATNGAIEGHPCHHLRVGEVPERSPDLPDAGVLLPPAVLEPSEQLQHQRPDVGIRWGAMGT